ncbi:MAG: hypothetical protein K2P80_14540 [Beijerinckiaceae bacterium]|nr:hypothetical protein [Beijerinckiaceae bacterium]
MELHLAHPAGADDVRRKVVSQSNGLVRLGQAIDADKPGKERRRFDLVTVDPSFAIDANIRLVESSQDRIDSAARSAPIGSEGEQVDVIQARAEAPPLMTRGLCIVDRWRQAAVVSEIINAHRFASPKTGPSVVDAEDLATGYRVHVGLWGGADVQWRSLMTRSVDYKSVGPHASFDIEAALGQLGLKRGSERRLISDAASVAVPSRTRFANDSKTGIWIHVEELLAAWEGDPLAVNCQTEKVEVRPGSDLSISRTYSLDLAAAERSHALRFGRAYQVAVGVVWLGGVSVASSEVEALAKNDCEVRIPCAAASIEAKAVRRFLRHEPLRPPVVLLPVSFADRADRYVRQTGPIAILRAPQKDEPDQDSRSWRVILPPRLALDEVVRHGVLDKDNTDKPRGAFESVNIDAPWHDFPIYGRPKGEAGPGRGLPSGEPLKSLSPGTPPITKDGKLAPAERLKRIPPDEPGEPVFMAGGKTDRQHPYWPDPAAEQFVIALRPAKRPVGEGYFEGQPIVVDVLAADDSFRSAVPVVIEFERVDEVRKSPTKGDVTHAMLVPTPPAAAYTDGRRLSDGPFSGGIPVQRVKVRLYRGEHVAADCWFAPRASTLRSWFDLAETIVAAQVAIDPAELAVAASLDSKFDDGRSPASISKRLGVFEALSKKLVEENEAAKKKGEKPKPDPMAQRWIAAAGIEVGARHVAAVADVLGERLRARPVPQLAGLATVEAVHAVKEPVRAPAFDRSANNPAWTRDEKVLALTRYEVRVSNDMSDPRRKLLEGYGMDHEPGRPISGWPEEPKEGATGLLLAGTVQVDLDSCSQLEVLADVVAPQGSAIDDQTRRRPDQYRLVGRWPEDETGRTSRALSLFGFSVDPSGRVTLPTSSVTLLRIDDLDACNKDSHFAGLDAVDLAAQQLEAIKREESARSGRRQPGPRITAFDPFKDTIARKLRVCLRTTTRHGELVRRIVPDVKVQLPEDFKPVPALSASPGNPREAETLDLWLPATRRPSQPSVHTVMPAFYWTHATARPARCVSHVREARVRIWLNRPWFSAGEGERLGIVLWPPRLRGLGNAPETGTVPRPDAPEQGLMDLADYTDDMLGPGGKFVTRWGADPIREAPASLGPFMSEHAFKDIPASNKPGRDPSYVPFVDIPIVSDDKLGADMTPATVLTAGLITYEPCFDVVSERWYVDVALNPGVVPGLVEPFVRFGLVRYQAHAIKGLNASTPVVAWGQVLPLRDAKAWWEAVPQPDRPGCIQVQVAGRTASRRDEQGARSPRMRVTLVESSNSAGLVGERTLETRDATYGSPHPATHDQELAWTTAFTVQSVDPASQLFVLIEEEEPYLGTQDEPVPSESQIEQAPTAQFSGPRYIARMPLPSPEKAGQAAAAQACGAA